MNTTRKQLRYLFVFFALLGVMMFSNKAYAASTNVSGEVKASTLADNASIKLTGGTVLQMDTAKTLKSISGDYVLTIEGDETLTVNNPDGTAISVNTIKSNSTMVINASSSGIWADGSIEINKPITVHASSDAIYSDRGTVTIFDRAELYSKNRHAICSESGTRVYGQLVAETETSSHACLYTKGEVVLMNGPVEITGVSYAIQTTNTSVNVINCHDVKIVSKNSTAIETDSTVGVNNCEYVYIKGETGIYSLQGVSINATDAHIIATDGVGIKMGNKKVTHQYDGHLFQQGSLTIKSKEEAILNYGESYLVFSGDVNVESETSCNAIDCWGTIEQRKDEQGNEGTITVIAPHADAAIQASSSLTLIGIVKASNPDGCAIRSYGKTDISGATVELEGSAYSYDSFNVSGSKLIVDSKADYGIYSRNTISLYGSDINVIGRKNALYSPEGSIYCGGSVTLANRSTKDPCILALGGNVELNPQEIKISPNSGTAIRSHGGDVILEGKVIINANYYGESSWNYCVIADEGDVVIAEKSEVTCSGRYGIGANGNVIVSGESLSVRATEGKAIYGKEGITVNPPLAILTPEGGRIKGDTIVKADGSAATYIVIEKRPLTGSVTIQGDVSTEGDTLKVICSGLPSGYKIQWQTSTDGERWTDCANGNNDEYRTRRGDGDCFFRVKVTALNYSGELYSKERYVKAIPALTGSVSYNGNNRVGWKIITSLDDDLDSIRRSVPEGDFHYQWMVSDTGYDGWLNIQDATGSSYTPGAAIEGRYLRVAVTVEGYTGVVYGDAVGISKQDNNILNPEKPVLTTESPYTTVIITNAKADQEYVFNDTGISPTDWSNAQSPSVDGTLTLHVQSGKCVRVYTRFKATEAKNAGTRVVFAYIFTDGETVLKGITLDKHELLLAGAGIYELNLSPLPEEHSQTTLWAQRKVTWTVSDPDAFGVYSNEACTKQVTLGAETDLKKVYVRSFYGPEAYIGATITATVIYGEKTYTDTCTCEVLNQYGQRKLQYLDFGYGMIIPPGVRIRVPFAAVPFNSAIGTMTFEKISGPSSTLSFNRDSDTDMTLLISVPENASEGTYKYRVKVDGKDTPMPSTITIDVFSRKVTVSFDANGGTGRMESQTMEMGTGYRLPFCDFDAPDGYIFEKWDQGDPGEVIIIGERTTIKALWKKHEHELEYVPSQEASCIWTGNRAYYQCESCSRVFATEEAKWEGLTVDDFVIPASGHTSGTPVTENKIDSTCDTAGRYDEVTYCQVCGDECKRETKSISAKGHDPIKHVQPKDATCTEEGNKEYYTCLSCGSMFEDANCSIEITDKNVVRIDPIKHNWNSWISLNKTQHMRWCLNDNTHLELEDHRFDNGVCPDCGYACEHPNTETRDKKEADCIHEGYTGDQYCKDCGQKITDGQTTPATAVHKYQSTISGQKKIYTCSVCGKTYEEKLPSNNAEYKENVIINKATDTDVSGAVFGKVCGRISAAGSTSITIKWNGVSGATGYKIYASKCNSGTKKYKLKLVKTASAKSRSYKFSKLDKGRYYKFIVMAVKGKTSLSVSKTFHIATTGGKYTNAKSFTLNVKSVSVKKGRTKAVKVKKTTKYNSKRKIASHRGTKYEISNKKIASVSSKGVVKGIKKGTCYLYVYAQDGIYKKIKVTVK